MILKGISITNGVAIGRVLHYTPDNSGTGADFSDPDAWTEGELARYRTAEKAVKSELNRLVRSTAVEGQTHGDIFYAHLAMLEDEVLNAEIVDCISNQQMCASAAVQKVFDRYSELLRRTQAPVIQERAVDLADIKLRLLRYLAGRVHRGLSQLPGPVVVVARDLMPSDAATLDRENVLAIVTQAGSQTSHSAIIARSFDIPAVLGVADALELLPDGETVVVDGASGAILTDIGPEEMEQYRNRREQWLLEKTMSLGIRNVQPITRDGARVSVKLNMAALTQQVLDARTSVDGVGMYRTDLLYMDRWDLPSEEEQFAMYRRVAEAFGSKPVTLCTLDVGGDKWLKSVQLPREENPFLGSRGIRFCLAQPEIFRTQLRAVLRASVYGNLRLIFPMISSVEDIRYAKALLEQAKGELRRRGEPFREHIPIGILVEVPSIALEADLAASEVDFASLGTNDLCQYLMAADRKNPAVAEYCRSFHPAVLRLFDYVTHAFHRQGKPVSACGEMGGDPLSAMALIGMGVDSLSMNVSSISGVKKMITSIELAQVRARVEELKKRCLTQDIRAALQELLDLTP